MKLMSFTEFTEDHLDAIVSSLNNPKVTRYLSSNIPQPYTIDDAKWWIQTGCKQQQIAFAIIVDNSFCGSIGLYLQAGENSNEAELGYWLSEGFWNQGIMTQAVRDFVDWVYKRTNVTRIYNPVTQENYASVRVMEKAGFQLEKTLIASVQHEGIEHNELLYVKSKL